MLSYFENLWCKFYLKYRCAVIHCSWKLQVLANHFEYKGCLRRNYEMELISSLRRFLVYFCETLITVRRNKQPATTDQF